MTSTVLLLRIAGMDDRFDPAEHAEHLRQVQDLATRARAAYQAKLVDDGVRLGTERDQAARRVQGAEREQAAAKVQAQRELKVAVEADRKAAELERKATTSKYSSEAQELREEAAQHRARAEVARQRARAADDEGDRLAWGMESDQVMVDTLEAQMRSTDQMKAIEREIDELDDQVLNAQEASATVEQLTAVERRIAEATTRGETKLAAELDHHAQMLRENVTFYGETQVKAISDIDKARLAELGIEVPVDALMPPGEVVTAPVAPSVQADTTTTTTTTTPAPVPAPADPTFEEATSGAPTAETTEPAVSPSTDVDVVTGEVAPPPEPPAADDTGVTPVGSPPSDDPAPIEPAREVPATPARVEADVSTEMPQVDIDADVTPFVEVDEPTIPESDDVLVDAS